jgi:hypothetical protein
MMNSSGKPKNTEKYLAPVTLSPPQVPNPNETSSSYVTALYPLIIAADFIKLRMNIKMLTTS